MKNILKFSISLLALFTLFVSVPAFASDLNQNSIDDATEPDVIVSTNQSLDAGEYTFQNLTITNNATLTLKGDPQSPLVFKGVKINAENITIDAGARISADGQGYGENGPGYAPVPNSTVRTGSYGGLGGGNLPSAIYGSALAPKDLGTGTGPSSRGGGAIWLNIANTLMNKGIISVQAGGERTSGGSIYIQTNTITGIGGITANGGYTLWPLLGMAGGGGRIAVEYNTSTYTGTLGALGGVSCFSGCEKAGGDGTVAFIDVDDNTLYIKDYFRFQSNDSPFNFKNISIEVGAKADTELNTVITADTLTQDNLSKFTLANSSTLNIQDVTLNGNALLYLSGADTLNINTLNLHDYSTISITPSLVSLTLNIPNVSVSTNASISADNKGYCAFEGPGAPSPDSISENYAIYAGASYGGVGGYANSTKLYGSEREPVDFGSGGSGGYNPICGGGAIRIISDNLVLNGTISSNGSYTSSGGSIYITANNLSGVGYITAKGGPQYCPYICSNGYGGGGRIAVYYEASTFSGTISAVGGNTCASGCTADDGTVVYEALGCQVNCNSSVLFLPGFEGSRLYREIGFEDCVPTPTPNNCKQDSELWFSTSDDNHEILTLDEHGKSQNTVGASAVGIYTKNDTQKLGGDLGETGILDEAESVNIYKSFLSDLKNWKSEDIIEDYAFIPYDWRLSLEDIITNGHASLDGKLSYTRPQPFSESFILQKLQTLQEKSRTGKVTIVAHSNGGLVTKALVQKLKDTNNPLYEKIDKIILVATPQIGTPEGLVALLHGIDLGPLGMIMSNERTRQLAENMPGVYNLLPSASYFTTVEPQYATGKLVSFENKPFFEPQTSQYGVFVSNATELKNYVLGTDGRPKPAYEDTVHPNIGNNELYLQAEATHQILDSWTPSPNTKVIQVAGWGEETVAGIDYEEIVTTACPQGAQCAHGSELSYIPRMVVDGDATVVAPSALWMSETNPNVERWWVNLAKYNGRDRFRTEHKDIFEVPNLRNFIKSRVQNLNFIDLENVVIDNDSTLLSDEARLHYILHSPLTLGVTDKNGNYTGLDPKTGEIKNEILDVNYEQIGEVQFLSVPAGVAYTLIMHGYEEGSFTLDVEKQVGNDVVNTTSFQGIPGGNTTVATMDIPVDFDVNTSELKIDNNGDNQVDKTLDATPEGITVYDTTPPEISMSFNFNINEVEFKGLDENIVSKKHSNTSTVATDDQGNTSTLYYTRYKEKPTRLKLTFNTITRNGVNTVFPNTNVTYDWDTKDGDLIDLDTRVFIKGVEKYVFNYKKKQNVTVIKVKKGNTVTTTTRTGFVGVTISTYGDEVKVNY